MQLIGEELQHRMEMCASKPNQTKPVLIETPQTFKNFPVMDQSKAQNSPIWADASSRVYLFETLRHALELRVELSPIWQN